MFKYVLKRIAGAIPLILIITIITFVIVRLAPGDPTKMFISPNTRPEDRERIKALIDTCENYVINKELPPKPEDATDKKCAYCSYQGKQ